MKWLLPAASLLISLVMVACGGGDGDSGGGGAGGGDEAQIRKAISDFSNAINDADAGKAHALLDAKSRESCKVEDLKVLLQLLKSFSGNQKLGVAEVRDIKVTGDKATAQVVATLGNERQDPDEQAFVKEGGKWKLAMEGGDCSA